MSNSERKPQKIGWFSSALDDLSSLRKTSKIASDVAKEMGEAWAPLLINLKAIAKEFETRYRALQAQEEKDPVALSSYELFFNTFESTTQRLGTFFEKMSDGSLSKPEILHEMAQVMMNIPPLLEAVKRLNLPETITRMMPAAKEHLPASATALKVEFSDFISKSITTLLPTLMAELESIEAQLAKMMNLNEFSQLSPSEKKWELAGMHEINELFKKIIFALDATEMELGFKEGSLSETLTFRSQSLQKMNRHFCHQYNKALAKAGYPPSPDVFPYTASLFKEREKRLKALEADISQGTKWTAAFEEAKSACIATITDRLKEPLFTKEQVHDLELLKAHLVSNMSPDQAIQVINKTDPEASTRFAKDPLKSILDQAKAYYTKEIIDQNAHLHQWHQQKKRLVDCMQATREQHPLIHQTLQQIERQTISSKTLQRTGKNLHLEGEKLRAQLAKHDDVSVAEPTKSTFDQLDEQIKTAMDPYIYDLYFKTVKEEAKEDVTHSHLLTPLQRVEALGQMIANARAITQTAAQMSLEARAPNPHAKPISPMHELVTDTEAITQTLKQLRFMDQALQRITNDPELQRMASLDPSRMRTLTLDKMLGTTPQDPLYATLHEQLLSPSTKMMGLLTVCYEITDKLSKHYTHDKKVSDDSKALMKSLAELMGETKSVKIDPSAIASANWWEYIQQALKLIKQITTILNTFSTAIAAFIMLAKEESLAIVHDVNQLLKELMLGMDALEATFYLKEGYLTQPIRPVLEQFHQTVTQLGFTFSPEDRPPYFEAVYLQRVQQITSAPSDIDKTYLENRKVSALNALEEHQSHEKRTEARRTKKEAASINHEINAAIDEEIIHLRNQNKNSLTLTIEMLEQLVHRQKPDTVATTQPTPLKERLAALKNNEKYRKHVPLLYRGHVGKLLTQSNISHLGETRKGIIEELKIELEKLKTKRQKNYLFFSNSIKAHYAKRIKACEALKNYMALAGYRYDDAIEHLRVKDAESYQLLKKYGAPLKRKIQAIEQAFSKHHLGLKTIRRPR